MILKLSHLFQILFTLLIVMLIGDFAHAQVQLEASVNMEEATLEDEIILKVNVSGSRKATEPDIPPIEGFQVIKSGTGSSFQIGNGVAIFTRKYQYTLIPQEEGDFTINPIRVVLDGKEFFTKPIKIKIDSSPSRFTPLTNQGLPKTPSNSNSFNEYPDIWINSHPNLTEAYVNQQILYKFQFITSKNISKLDYTLPEFDGFRLEEVGKERKYEKSFSGKTHVVLEKNYILTPLKSGNFTLDPIQARIEIPANRDNSRVDNFFNDPFFNLRPRRTIKKNLKSNSVNFKIKELPSPIPKNFTGLVGDFKLEGNLSSQSISQDESLTYEIKISGSGNIKDGTLPDLSFSNFKSYIDKPQVDISLTDSGTQGSKVFKIALVPQKSGELLLDPIKIVYFNIKKNKYITLETNPLSIHVKSNKSNQDINLTQNEDSNLDIQKENVKITDDLAPIKLDAEFSKKRNTSSDDAIYLLLGGLLFFINFLFLIGIKLKSAAGNRSKKTSKSLSDLESDLKKVLKQKEVNQVVLSEVLNSFLKFAASNLKDKRDHSLTGQELVKILISKQIKDKDLSEYRDWLSGIEACCYGGVPSDKKLQDWIQSTLRIAKIIHLYLK